jgi:hypothetical protein
MTVRWDSDTALKARAIIEGRIRELADEWAAKPHAKGLDPECGACGIGYFPRRKGAELQAGLEEALRRDQDGTS